MLFTDQVRRCRNEGGHDLSWCSEDDEYTDDYKDVACNEKKPKYRSCHLSAINDETIDARFEFTKHNYFTADTAHAACQEIGGFVPNLEEELEAIWLQQAMELLTSWVQVGWPFSMKWMTWPVRDKLIIYKQFEIKYCNFLASLFSMLIFFIIFVVYISRRAAFRPLFCNVSIESNIQVSIK